MGVIATLLMTTFLAGVVGTGLGGLIGAMLQKNSNMIEYSADRLCEVVRFLKTEKISDEYKKEWLEKQK